METKYLAVPDNTVARFFPGISEKQYAGLYAQGLTEKDLFIKLISAQGKVSLLNIKAGMLKPHLTERLETEDQVLSGFNLVVRTAAGRKDLLELKSQYFEKINKTIDAVRADRKNPLTTALAMQSKLIVFILDTSTMTWHYCGLNSDAEFQDGAVDSYGATAVVYRALLGVSPENLQYAQKQNLLNKAILCLGFKDSDVIESVEIYHRSEEIEKLSLYVQAKEVVFELFRKKDLVTPIKLESHALLELKDEQIEYVPYHYGLKTLSDLSAKNAANKSVGIKLVFNGSAGLQAKDFNQQLAVPVQLMLQLLDKDNVDAQAIRQLRAAAVAACRKFKPKIDLFRSNMLVVAKNISVVMKQIHSLEDVDAELKQLLKAISQKLNVWQLFSLQAIQDPKVFNNPQFTLVPLRREASLLQHVEKCKNIYNNIESSLSAMGKSVVSEFPAQYANYENCRSLRVATKNYCTQLDVVLAYCDDARAFVERFPDILQNEKINLGKVREFLELPVQDLKEIKSAGEDSELEHLKELKAVAKQEMDQLKGVIGFNLADLQVLQRRQAKLQLQAVQLQTQANRLHDQIEDIAPSYKTKAKRCCRYRIEDTAYLFAVTSSKAAEYKKTSLSIAGVTTTAGAYYFRNALFNLGATGFNFVRGYGMMMIIPIMMVLMQAITGGNRPNLR